MSTALSTTSSASSTLVDSTTTTLSSTTTSTPATTPAPTSTSTSTSTPTPTPLPGPPPFSCGNGYGYTLSSNRLYMYDLETKALISAIGNSTIMPAGQRLLDVAYNPLDNYLYGFVQASGSVQGVQIASDGTYVLFPGQSSTDAWIGGDFDANGYLWLLTIAGTAWAQMDFRPGSPTYGQITDSGTVVGPQDGNATSTTGILDWVYVPGGGNQLWAFYRYQSKPRYTLGVFDLTTKAWADVYYLSTLSPLPLFTALFSDGTHLLAYNYLASSLWKFDVTDPQQYSLVWTGGLNKAVKGARCQLAPSI